MKPDIKTYAGKLNESGHLSIYNEKGPSKIQARLGRTPLKEKQRLLNDGMIVLWEYEDWVCMVRDTDADSPLKMRTPVNLQRPKGSPKMKTTIILKNLDGLRIYNEDNEDITSIVQSMRFVEKNRGWQVVISIKDTDWNPPESYEETVTQCEIIFQPAGRDSPPVPPVS